MALYEITPTNMKGSGFFFKGRAGENMLRGKLVYKNANGAWYLADADLAAETPALGLTMGRANTGQIVRVLKEGYLGRSDWAWVVGGEVYASSTPGELTQVPPVAPSLTQVVGMATRPDMVQFDPSLSTSGATLTGFIGDYTYMVVRSGANYTVYDNQGAIASGPGLDADVQINWALTTGGAGCVVYLKEGSTFAIDDPIVFTANGQVVRGGGRSTFIDGDGLATTEHGIVLSGFTDCQIRNLSIQTQDGGGKICHCVFIEDGAHRFLVEDVVVVDSDSDGIHIEGTTITGGIVRGCDVLDTDNYGIQVDMDAGNYADYIIIDQNRVTGGGNSNIAFSASSGNRYCEITNNVSYSCGLAEGIYVVAFHHGVISDNISHSNATEGIQVGSTTTDTVIADNVVYNNAGHGIFLETADDNVISGNLCEHNDSGDTATFDGIHVDANSIDNIISGNKTYDNHRYGIAVLGTRNKVTDNKSANNDRYGIYVAAGDCQINDNDCYDNGQDAAATYHEIYLTGDADQCTVHDNHISSPGDSSEDCIHLADGAIDCTIMNNYCYNGMGSGIALTANNDDCSIIGNRCIDNDDYGIEITAATCNDTRVKENHLEGNVTGQFLDSGTDTQTPWCFAPVSDPNATLGDHPVIDLPDATDTNVYAQILVPLEFQQLVTCSIIVVTAATGDLVWTVDTDFGKICAGEAYNTHTDTGGATEAITIDLLSCLDITAALTNIVGGDLVGINFMRDGDNVADTIGDSVYYLGIRMRYV